MHKVVTSLELLLFQVFQPLLQPMVTPETLPMHPVRELQERCQQQAEGLEYKASRTGNMATVEVFVRSEKWKICLGRPGVESVIKASSSKNTDKDDLQKSSSLPVSIVDNVFMVKMYFLAVELNLLFIEVLRLLFMCKCRCLNFICTKLVFLVILVIGDR